MANATPTHYIQLKNFKNILVVYDEKPGGGTLLRKALVLASIHNARLTVAAVLTDYSKRSIVERQLREFDAIVPYLEHDIVKVNFVTLMGKPTDQIMSQVIYSAHDLLIIGDQIKGGLWDTFSNSLSFEFVRKCPCAVLILKQPPMGEKSALSWSDILVAIPNVKNGDLDDAIDLMNAATEISRSHGACLHVVHAWKPENQVDDALSITGSRNDLLDRQVTKYLYATNALIAKYPYSTFEHEVHLPQGKPKNSIIELAKQKAVDLVVMGVGARTWPTVWSIKGTLEAVLNAVDCNLLIVKPSKYSPRYRISRK